MRRWLLYFACVLTLGLSLSAQAKLLIVNTGDELFEVAELPLQLQREMQDGYKMGYICRHFGVFWADFQTWNCRLVAVDLNREQYAELPVDMVAQWKAQYPWKMAKRSFWNKYGAIPVSAAVMTILILCGRQFVRRRRSDNLTDTIKQADE